MHRELQYWQHQYLGNTRFPTSVTNLELRAFFTFSDAELEQIKRKFKNNLRIAAALQQGFVTMTGRPLDALGVIPRELLKHVGDQLGMDAQNNATLRSIYKRKATLFDHQQWAVAAAQFRYPSDKQLAMLLAHLKRESVHFP